MFSAEVKGTALAEFFFSRLRPIRVEILPPDARVHSDNFGGLGGSDFDQCAFCAVEPVAGGGAGGLGKASDDVAGRIRSH